MTSSPATSPDSSAPQVSSVEKLKAYLELQNSFETVIVHKDSVIESLRKRVNDQNVVISTSAKKTQLLKAKLVERTKKEIKCDVVTQTDAVEMGEAKKPEVVKVSEAQTTQVPAADDQWIVEVKKTQTMEEEEGEVKMSEAQLTSEMVSQEEFDQISETKVALEEQYNLLESQLSENQQLLDTKNQSLNETVDELREKREECNELLEEIQDLREEIIDLKSSLEEKSNYSDDSMSYRVMEERIRALTVTNKKLEREIDEIRQVITIDQSQLREKEVQVTHEQDEEEGGDMTRLNAELVEVSTKLKNVMMDVEHAVSAKDNLLKKNFNIQVFYLSISSYISS